MRPPFVLLLTLVCTVPAWAQGPGIPLSERNTQVEARQIIEKMKTAYSGLQGYSAVVSRVSVGPAEEFDGTDSGSWRLSWTTAPQGKFKLAIDAKLAAAPTDATSLFAGTAGPLSVIYDGKQGGISTPSKKVYGLQLENDDPQSVWRAAADAARFDTLLGSLLYGSDPVSDFAAPMRELRIGKQQMLTDGLCDVVTARFSDISGRQRWSLTMLVGHDDGLLRQIITTGSRDGRDRLQVETIVSQQPNARFGGATFRVPALTEKPVFTKEDAPAPAPKPAPVPVPEPSSADKREERRVLRRGSR